MWGRLQALVLLGFALIKTLLLRLSRRDSLRQFSEHYSGEGILAVTSEEAQILNRASGCIACGLCDAEEGERVAQSRGAYSGLMAFVLSGVRQLPDYAAVARSISGVGGEALTSAERRCPVGVPIVDLARLVRSQAKRHEATQNAGVRA